MGDDERAAPETTPDRAWAPRHRSRRAGRARKDRPSLKPADEPATAANSAGDPVAAADPAGGARDTTDAAANRDTADAAVTRDGADAMPDSSDTSEPEAPPTLESPETDAAESAPAIGTAAVPAAHAIGAPTRLLPVAATATEEDDEHDWLDQDAGPVVRPYTLTGGRSRPFTSGLNLLTHVEALYAPDADLVALQPEQRAILSLTRTAMTVAELAARLDLPVGVVRVLVGDLIQANLVSTFEADAAVRAPDDDILQAVIDGLRAL